MQRTTFCYVSSLAFTPGKRFLFVIFQIRIKKKKKNKRNQTEKSLKQNIISPVNTHHHNPFLNWEMCFTLAKHFKRFCHCRHQSQEGSEALFSFAHLYSNAYKNHSSIYFQNTWQQCIKYNHGCM